MDIYSDKDSTTLNTIATIKDLPPFVKTAKLLDKSKLDDKFFAYQEKRAFPTYDPASTYTSFAYYCMSNDKLPKRVKENLVKSAMFFDILDDVRDFAKKYVSVSEGLTKKANEDSYALPEKMAYPISNDEQLNLASERFSENYAEYNLNDRVKIAEFIVKKSAEYNKQIQFPMIIKYAHLRDMTCDPLVAAVKIGELGIALPNSEMFAKKAFLQLGSSFVSARPTRKTIALMHGVLDKVAGMTKYAASLTDPTDILYNMSVKQASSVLERLNISGNDYDARQITALPKEVFASALGDDVVKELSVEGTEGQLDQQKIMEIIPTLPRDEQEILKQFIEQELAKGGNSSEEEMLIS